MNRNPSRGGRGGQRGFDEGAERERFSQDVRGDVERRHEGYRDNDDERMELGSDYGRNDEGSWSEGGRGGGRVTQGGSWGEGGRGPMPSGRGQWGGRFEQGRYGQGSGGYAGQGYGNRSGNEGYGNQGYGNQGYGNMRGQSDWGRRGMGFDDDDRGMGAGQHYGQGGFDQGYEPRGHGAGRFAQFEGFGQGGYGQGGYGQGGYGQGGYDQSYGRGGYGQGGYGQGGYDQSYGQGAYGQRGYGQGRFGQSEGFGQSGGRRGSPGGGFAGSPGRSGAGQGQTRKSPKGYTRSDERIREDICEAMAREEQIDPSEISVEVKGGEVKLTGTVSDREEKWAAERIAFEASGVKDVQNQLRVGQGESTSQHTGAGSSMSGSTVSLGGGMGSVNDRTEHRNARS